jgi:hypothetical protein
VCREHAVEGYYDTRWLTGLWSTQAKVEGIMLQAAWHCGSNGSVVNYSLGEPGRTPLYVGLRQRGALWSATVCCSPIGWESSLTGKS